MYEVWVTKIYYTYRAMDLIYLIPRMIHKA